MTIELLAERDELKVQLAAKDAEIERLTVRLAEAQRLLSLSRDEPPSPQSLFDQRGD